MKPVALVTGASRGIGRGIALQLAQIGYDIVFTAGKALEEAEITKKLLEDAGAACAFEAFDFARHGEAERAAAFAFSAFGHLDAVVCNAGDPNGGGAIDEITPEHIDRLITTNLISPLTLCGEVARGWIKDKTKGNICVITSVRGIRAFPGDAVYGATKAGLNRAVESMALDLAPFGIRVNAVAPGYIQVRDDEKTVAHSNQLGPRIPRGRSGQPEDVANAVEFLFSDKADYITGVTLKVDGGLILPGMPEAEGGPGWGGRNA